MDNEETAIALARELLAEKGTLRIPVNTTSMIPFARVGDYLHIAAVSGKPRVGDILMVDHDGKALTHRLIRYLGRSLLMMGDALWRPDPLIESSQIIGRVVMRERGERLTKLDGFFIRFGSCLKALRQRIFLSLNRQG
jgi:alkylated DNA nucleotide flippase Atl1